MPHAHEKYGNLSRSGVKVIILSRNRMFATAESNMDRNNIPLPSRKSSLSSSYSSPSPSSASLSPEKSSPATSSQPCTADNIKPARTPKSASQLEPYLHTLQLSEPPTEMYAAPPPLQTGPPSLQRRPNFARHLRSKSSNQLPSHVAPPLMRSTSLPPQHFPYVTQIPPPAPTSNPLYSTPERRRSNSPGSSRRHTPSPPPGLVLDIFPSHTPVLSRTPSMSSLETIEDTPEEEEAAELEPVPIPPPMMRSLSEGRVLHAGRGLERKRWSICGGEGRADLELGTIWEDTEGLEGLGVTVIEDYDE